MMKGDMGTGVVVAKSPAQPRMSESEERRDFFHRVRNDSEISKWRNDFVNRLRRDCSESALLDLSRVMGTVDRAIGLLRELGRILDLIYGEAKVPSNNNKPPPLEPDAKRVLARLGAYRELGHCFDSSKGNGVAVDDLIPPKFGQALCISLSKHGRKICLPKRPLCDSCDVRNFCVTYRRAEVAKRGRLEAPTVVDLFAGAGGFSEGFLHAGFRVILAVDCDHVALKTYWLNHPGVAENRIVHSDIRNLKAGSLRRLTRHEPVDVLIGSPPCQGFSHVGFRAGKAQTGYRVSRDQRNYLSECMISAVSELQPTLFLLENVPGMQSARRENLSFMEHAARTLEDKCRYQTAIWRLNASAFGVPQDRIRYFLVASKLGPPPPRPDEEYQDIVRTDFDVDALPPVTFEEAVFDLPPLKAGSGSAVESWNRTQPRDDVRYRRYLAKFGLINSSSLIYNHTARPQNYRDLELYSTLQPGENSLHAIDKYGRDDLMRYRRDIFADKYARLRGDRPSKTILSHLAKDGNGYIHPSQTRSITVREASRIQSFHDGYIFCGSVSQQWIQVGNAVPPLLAEGIARNFMRLLRKAPRS
jgi:DNA (cytosine-5)-methyltransferase 1